MVKRKDARGGCSGDDVCNGGEEAKGEFEQCFYRTQAGVLLTYLGAYLPPTHGLGIDASAIRGLP